MNFREEAQTLEAEIIADRRYLHEHPEISYKEKETTEYLEKRLREFGLEPHRFPDYYGVWADICPDSLPCRCDKGENGTGLSGIEVSGDVSAKFRTVLLRSDIDALPVQEETGCAYASRNTGVMHACGHDCHMAMLLGATKMLASHRQELNGTVRVLFQSAEESCHGAQYYIEKGLLDDVDAVYGCHVWATLDAPGINVEAGPRMSSCDNFTITVTGKASHGAEPNYGVDAIAAAAAIILQIQMIVSRKCDPREHLAITIGEINGGQKFNIVADKVVMKGTVRTHSTEIRRQVEGWIRDMAECTAKANGANAELQYEYCPGVLYNDPKLSEIAQNSARKMYGEEGLEAFDALMSSEDFSYYLDKVPGVFAFIGIRNKEKDCLYPNHNSRFNVDESVLKRGAALYAQFAFDYLLAGEESLKQE